MAKTTLTIVTGGNERSGKSSLLGHLLFSLGLVPQSLLHRYKRDSLALDKQGKEFAWVLDTYESERIHGFTLEPGVAEIHIHDQTLTFFDSPGRSDSVPGFISAATHADGLLLVVDAREKTFGRLFEATDPDQTKEHGFIARGLGMTQVVLAVNKMEKCGWSEARFQYVTDTVSAYMKSVGFKDVVSVPVSALLGTNLVTIDYKSTPWYTGPPLLDAVSRLQPCPRDAQKPIRISVDDVVKLHHGSQLGDVITGKVLGGVVSLKTKLFIIPSLVLCTVKQIVAGGENVDKVAAGWNVDITIGNLGGDFGKLGTGDVACGESQTVSVAKRFRVNGITFDLRTPVTKRQAVMVYIHSTKVAGRITHLISSKDGQTVISRPRLLPKYKIATLEVETEHPISIEKCSNYQNLGKVVLRTEGKTVFCGNVSELLE